MPTFAGIGRSTRRDARAAGEEAARAACATLRGAPELCLVFATSGYEPGELLAGVRAVTAGAALSGCSGEGVITGPVSDEGAHAVGVMALRSDALSFTTFLVGDYARDSAAAGAELARQVRAASRGDEIGLLVFPDGLLGNCGELLEALDRALGPALPIVGGTAGDALAFQRTSQFQDARAVNDAVAAVLVRGRGHLEIAVSHGCSPIGLERRITGAEGGWLRSIDGQPAWTVFREYLAGDPQDLDTEVAIHLSLGEALPPEAARDYEPYIIHTPLGLERGTGALFFPGGGLRSGTAIRLARRDPERIRESARASAARIAARRSGTAPAFVLQFDCAGRGKQLFGSHVAEYIVQPLQEELGRDTPWLGFHTFGEIAPIGTRTFYHNFTVALCALYEES